MNKAAQATGRKARGVPKSYTPEELQRRSERLKLARAKRWPHSLQFHADNTADCSCGKWSVTFAPILDKARAAEEHAAHVQLFRKHNL